MLSVIEILGCVVDTNPASQSVPDLSTYLAHAIAAVEILGCVIPTQPRPDEASLASGKTKFPSVGVDIKPTWLLHVTGGTMSRVSFGVFHPPLPKVSDLVEGVRW